MASSSCCVGCFAWTECCLGGINRYVRNAFLLEVHVTLKSSSFVRYHSCTALHALVVSNKEGSSDDAMAGLEGSARRRDHALNSVADSYLLKRESQRLPGLFHRRQSRSLVETLLIIETNRVMPGLSHHSLEPHHYLSLPPLIRGYRHTDCRAANSKEAPVRSLLSLGPEPIHTHRLNLG